MPLERTEAIVLSGFRYGESSKIITLYSESFGKFSAIAKGIRNVKSKFSGVFDNLNLVSVVLNKKDNKSLQFLSKSEVVSAYNNIKSDLNKLNIAFNISELVNKTTIEYDKNTKIFILIKNILNELENAKTKFDIFLLYFQMKLLKYSGFSTEDIIDGNNIVSERVKYYGNEVIDEYLNLRSEIENCDIKNLYDIEFDKKQLSILKIFFDSQFTRNFQNIKFFKTNKIFEQINSTL